MRYVPSNTANYYKSSTIHIYNVSFHELPKSTMYDEPFLSTMYHQRLLYTMYNTLSVTTMCHAPSLNTMHRQQPYLLWVVS